MRIEPSNPFHIAKAYGVTIASPLRPAQEAAPIARIQPKPQEHLDPTARLVAGTVPGKVDFSGDAPAPSSDTAIPMYRHPADRNAAADEASRAAGIAANLRKLLEA